MGYLTFGGEYKEGDPGDVMLPYGNWKPKIEDSDRNFAETAVQDRSVPVIKALSNSPVFKQALREAGVTVAEPSVWLRGGKGALSWLEDCYWFGYAMAAWTGALGPTRKQEIVQINKHMWGLINSPEKLCVTTSLIVTVVADKAAPEAVGRFLAQLLAGIAIQYGLKFGTQGYYRPSLKKGLLVFGPALFLSSSMGAAHRMANKYIDEGGNLAKIDMIDLAFAVVSGIADYNEISPLKRQIIRQIQNQARELEWNYESHLRHSKNMDYEEINSDPIYNKLKVARNNLDLMYELTSKNTDKFFDELYEIIAISKEMKASGFEHPATDFFSSLILTEFCSGVRWYWDEVKGLFNNMLKSVSSPPTHFR